MSVNNKQGKIELLKKLSISTEEYGDLVRLCCDTNSNSYAGFSKDKVVSLYFINSETGLIDKIKDLEKDDELITMEFDKHSKFYMVTKCNGLKIFDTINEPEPIYTDVNWKGIMCPMQGQMDAIMGIYNNDICWLNYPNPTSKSDYSDANNQYVTIIKNLSDKWILNLSENNVHMKVSYYGDRVMYYLKTYDSYKILEDGVKSLHNFGSNKVYGTYMSVPINAPFHMPFSFEIPICTDEELLFLSVAGIYGVNGKRIFSFDYEEECNNSFGEDDIKPCFYSATSHNGYKVPEKILLAGLTCHGKNVIHIMKEYACE